MREPRRIIKHLEAILEAILEASEGHGRAEPAVRVARVKPRVEDGREHSCVPGCAAAEAVARRRGGHARVDVDAESTEMRARRRRGPRVVVAAAAAVVVVRAEGIVRGEIVRVPVVVLVHVVVVVVVVVVFVVRHAAHVAESAALGLAAGAPRGLARLPGAVDGRRGPPDAVRARGWAEGRGRRRAERRHGLLLVRRQPPGGHGDVAAEARRGVHRQVQRGEHEHGHRRCHQRPGLRTAFAAVDGGDAEETAYSAGRTAVMGHGRRRRAELLVEPGKLDRGTRGLGAHVKRRHGRQIRDRGRRVGHLARRLCARSSLSQLRENSTRGGNIKKAVPGAVQIEARIRDAFNAQSR